MEQHQGQLPEIPEKTYHEKRTDRTAQEHEIQVREPVDLPTAIHKGERPQSLGSY